MYPVRVMYCYRRTLNDRFIKRNKRKHKTVRSKKKTQKAQVSKKTSRWEALTNTSYTMMYILTIQPTTLFIDQAKERANHHVLFPIHLLYTLILPRSLYSSHLDTSSHVILSAAQQISRARCQPPCPSRDVTVIPKPRHYQTCWQWKKKSSPTRMTSEWCKRDLVLECLACCEPD